jgi:hypothetical protein
MPGTEDELRATSDAVIADARTLASLEEEKRPIDADDPALVPVSKQIEKVAVRLVHETVVERTLAVELRSESGDEAQA